MYDDPIVYQYGMLYMCRPYIIYITAIVSVY